MHESLLFLTRMRLAPILVVALMAPPATVSWAQQQALPNVVQLETEEEAVRRYAVEVIVFEYAGPASNTTELFEPEPMPEDHFTTEEDPNSGAVPRIFSDRPLAQDPDEMLPVAIDPADDEDGRLAPGEESPFVALPDETLEEIPTYENAGIELIDPADFQLTAAWQKLRDLDAYRPLMHAGWIQPTVEKEATLPLALRRIGDPPLRLSGEFTLYLSRFLHLVVDLSLEAPPSQRPVTGREPVRYYGDRQSSTSIGFGATFDAPSTFYRINEDRIVRNDETRYFDHPKFGVIARVTRIEEAVPEDLDTTDDLLPR